MDDKNFPFQSLVTPPTAYLIICVLLMYFLILGDERNSKQKFVFRFRQCQYRISGGKKAGKFVIIWIDFKEDIFPVHFYSESENNSHKSIQRITNFLAFFLRFISIFTESLARENIFEDKGFLRRTL